MSGLILWWIIGYILVIPTTIHYVNKDIIYKGLKQDNFIFIVLIGTLLWPMFLLVGLLRLIAGVFYKDD